MSLPSHLPHAAPRLFWLPQASICTELIKRLLQHGPALSAASGAVAELDCLCSFAAAARELGYCRPVLVRDSLIHIEGGEADLPPFRWAMGRGSFKSSGQECPGVGVVGTGAEGVRE